MSCLSIARIWADTAERSLYSQDYKQDLFVILVCAQDLTNLHWIRGKKEENIGRTEPLITLLPYKLSSENSPSSFWHGFVTGKSIGKKSESTNHEPIHSAASPVLDMCLMTGCPFFVLFSHIFKNNTPRIINNREKYFCLFNRYMRMLQIHYIHTRLWTHDQSAF